MCTEFLTIANFINFHITDNVAMLENNTDLRSFWSNGSSSNPRTDVGGSSLVEFEEQEDVSSQILLWQWKTK